MISIEEIEKIEAALKKINGRIRIFHAREEIDCFIEIHGERTVPGEFFENKRVICFSGIGNPKGFYNLLSRTGTEIVKKHSRRDHHEWTQKELKKLIDKAADKNLEVVTTEKDRMRLPEDLKFKGWMMAIKMVIKEKEEWTEFINEIPKQNTSI
jgi:tetraacyldisaccharide-1-P 4'-kinase